MSSWSRRPSFCPSRTTPTYSQKRKWEIISEACENDLHDEHCCGRLQDSQCLWSGERRVCIRSLTHNVCVLWFLCIASHHRRSGRRLCNVPGSGSSTHLEIYFVRVPCEFAVLCVCSYGIIAAMTAQALGFQKRSLPLIENLDEKVANCNNPALLEELLSRIMWFLHRPIFRIVREYPGTETEVRAHQMTRKLRSSGFTPQKSELSSHQIAHSGVVPHQRSP